MTTHDKFISRARRTRVRRAAASLAAVALLAACGSSDDDAASDTSTGDATADSVAASSDATDVATAAPIENSESVSNSGAALVEYDAGADPAIGTPAPIITGQTFDGSEITIGGPTDGPTMLVFLAHWCPHCNDEVPAILELRDSGGIPDELSVIGISTAVDESAPNYPPSQWVVDKGWDYPTLADTTDYDAFRSYGGAAFPYVVILDEDGNVLARKDGASTTEQIGQFIDAALTRA